MTEAFCFDNKKTVLLGGKGEFWGSTHVWAYFPTVKYSSIATKAARLDINTYRGFHQK